jgi:hypothetical protein
MVPIDPAQGRTPEPGAGSLLRGRRHRTVGVPATLTRLNALDLVAMTPSARHVCRADLSYDSTLRGQVTVSMPATVHRPRWPTSEHTRLLTDEQSSFMEGAGASAHSRARRPPYVRRGHRPSGQKQADRDHRRHRDPGPQATMHELAGSARSSEATRLSNRSSISPSGPSGSPTQRRGVRHERASR